MDNLQIKSSFVNKNLDVLSRILVTVGCLSLVINDGNCRRSVSLSSAPEEVLEFNNITLICSFHGLENSSFSRWINYTNSIQESSIGSNGNSCIASGFLNDSKRFVWACNRDNSFSLTIKNVTRTQHKESWGCRQMFTSSNNVTILVKVPVEKVNLYGEEENGVTVIENKTLKLFCNTSYCRPAAHILWFICPRQCLINETEDVTTKNISSSLTDSNGFISTESSFEFSPDRSKHGWHVFCSAINMETTKVSSNALTLNIIYPPKDIPRISGHGDIYRVIENTQAKLTCSITGGNPLPDLLWECNNGSSTKRSNESTVTSSVSWVAKQGQNKKCFCRSLHSESNQSVEVNLDVLFPPKVPNVSTDSVNVESTINKIINTSLVIHCNSTGNPEPNFIWLLPDKSISKGDALIINHIDMSNKGTYYCKAENRLNPSNGNVEIGRSEVSIDVHLLIPPTSPELRFGGSDGRLIQTDSIFVVEDDSISISCSSSGNPEPECSFSNASKEMNRIELSNVTNDTKITCTASNTMTEIGESREGKADKELSIIVLHPPRIPVIQFEVNRQDSARCISEKIQLSAMEYTGFSMVCDSEAKPNASYSWYGPITTTLKYLLTHNITREKKGTYSCYAFNTMERTFGGIKRGESHKSVRLDVLYPPAIGRLAGISAVEDSTLNVSCPVTPGNPAATNVSWTTNENKIISTSKELYIHQIKRKDNGFYKCLAVNKMNPSCGNETEGEVSRSFHLNVVYKTTVTSLYVKGKHGLDPVTLRENDSLELVCQTESNPKSSISIYFKDDVLIFQSNVNTLTYSKTTASCSNDGIYTCVGKNIHNEKEPSRNHLTLHILCSPRPSPAVDFQEHIFTSERKTVVLTFVALAHPVPTKAGFKWLKEQQKSIWIYLQESDRFHIVTSGLQTNLTISNVTEKDLGNYRLTIENSIGIYDQSFHVLNEVPPAKPTHFVIIDDSLTNSSATLSWKPFKGYDKEQIFILQYKKETFQQFTTINITDNGGLEMNHTIMNLLSGTRYLVQISVANGFGRSDNVTLRFQTKSKPASFEELIVIEQSVTETSLTVQWKPGNDGGDKQLFEINYKKTDSEEWTLLLTDDMETSDYMIRQYIGGLERGSTYQLYLMATNTYGNSDKSEIIEFQTKRSNSCQCKVTQSFIIWILAGLLAAITLAAISVTSTICLRRKYFCRRLADEDSITSKQDRMKANSSKEIYEEIKQETGTEMVNLRQKYERLDTPEKGDSSNSKLVIYEDIHIPTEIGGEKENKTRVVDGYEVPAAFSDKNKLIRKKEDDDKSTGKNTNFTEYVNLEL